MNRNIIIEIPADEAAQLINNLPVRDYPLTTLALVHAMCRRERQLLGFEPRTDLPALLVPQAG